MPSHSNSFGNNAEKARLSAIPLEVEGEVGIKILTRDIVGQFIDWIAVYPADRSVWPYTQKIEIHYHFIRKIIEEIL